MREMTTEDWTQWLTDQEVVELQKLNENPILLKALEKVLCHEIYNNGVLKPGEPADFSRNFLLAYITNQGAQTDNEKLGETVRSYWWGLHALESGLKEISKFKIQEERSQESINVAE